MHYTREVVKIVASLVIEKLKVTRTNVYEQYLSNKNLKHTNNFKRQYVNYNIQK